MNSTRLIVFGALGLVVGILIGFGFRGSIATWFDLEAATPVATSQVLRGGIKDPVYKTLGINQFPQEYPAGVTAPKLLLSAFVPTYTNGRLSKVETYNLLDLKAGDLKACLDGAADVTLQDCLLPKLSAQPTASSDTTRTE